MNKTIKCRLVKDKDEHGSLQILCTSLLDSAIEEKVVKEYRAAKKNREVDQVGRVRERKDHLDYTI
jgi:hypothetical protein